MSQAASPLPEQTTVRWAARGGALALAAIAALIFMHRFSVATPGQRGEGATVVSISVEMQPSVRPVQKPEHHPPPQAPMTYTEAAAIAQPAPAASGPGEPYRLWTYSAGRIVFNNADQYERCRQARARGGEAADCPPATDRHEMILAAVHTDAPPLVIVRRPLTRGWR